MVKNQAGYSLVELMVTVAVIGIVASVSLGSYTRTVTGMKANLAKNQMQGFAKHFKADTIDGRTTIEVYGNGCTACYAHPGWVSGLDLTVGFDKPLVDSHWRRLGFDQTPLDPWNRPYMFDENEGEVGPNDCRFDSLYSAGPDGIFEGPGDGDDVYGDDIIVRLSYAISRPNCPANPHPQFGNSIL